MNTKPLSIALVLVLTACVTTPAVMETTTSTASGEVLFAPAVVDQGTQCMVGFTVTYPKDTAPHSRNIRVTTIWSDTSQDYALPLPPRGAPESFTQNADGTTTFTGTINDSIDRCDPELTARTLAIGPCANGKCPPARFVPNEDAARLGLREAEY